MSIFRPARRDHSTIYAEALASTLSHGYPLWWPEPLETGEIQFGDVGYIDEQGVFVRLFNTANPQPISGRQNQFEPAPLPSLRHAPAERENALPAGTYVSKGVEQTTATASIQGNGPSAGGDFEVEYTCKQEHGAILELKSPAKQLFMSDTKSLRGYVLQNYPKWQHYASDDMDLVDAENLKLYFVRGWLKTAADWTTTAFTTSGAKWKVGAHAGAGGIAGAGAEFAHSKSTTGPVVSRYGKNLLLKKIEDHKGKKGKGAQVSAAHDTAVDQCIFMKYYSVKPRYFKFLQKLEAGAGPASLPDQPPEDADQSVLVSDADLQGEEQGSSGPILPVDALLDYILENSDAEIALASDEDLISLVKGEAEEWPRDMAQFLHRTKPEIAVDDQKCGTIPLYESIRKRRQYDYTHRNPDDAEDGFNIPGDMSQVGHMVDGRLLLGPSASPYDWQHMQFKHKDAENGPVTSVAISPNGKWVAASFDDITVTVWRLKDGMTLQNLDDQGHNDTVWTIAWSPDSTALASGSADSDVIIWDVATGHLEHKLSGHRSDIMALAYSPDGSVLASGATDCEVRLWDTETGELKHKLEGHSSDIMRILFSLDGTKLASCADSGVMLWDPRTGRRTAELKGHTSAVWCIAFAHEGDRLATGSEDKSARIWNAEDGAELVTLQEHTNAVWAVAFSPDGGEVATASYDGSVVTCDSWTGERRHIFGEQQTALVEAVAYSTQGHLIASGSADGHVRVWDTSSGEAVAEFQGHEEKVKSVMFTPDDRELVSYAEDGTIRAWGILDALALL